MAKLSEEQMEKGRDLFVEKHPRIQARIRAVSQEEAECMGVSLKELVMVEVMRAVEEEAAAVGESSHDYFLRFVADSEEQRQKMIAENQQEINKFLGI